jgi:NADPH:quinone reductase-like Zn-dependent oxidoreductase
VGAVRAIVWVAYGAAEGLELREVPKPTPKAGALRIRVRATSVAAGDCELRALRFSLGLRVLVRLLMGVTRPKRKVLGQQFAGEVEALGSGVTRFRKGDRVYGTTGFGFGAYAEYLCVPERRGGSAVALLPSNLSFEEAAAVPTGGLEALRFLRKAGNLDGRTILINGAGGGIGTFAVQLAKHFGASVTGVESPGRGELVRSIGADRVLDYTRQDFTKTGDRYDFVFDVVGSRPVSESLRALRPGGTYLTANPRWSAMARAPWVFANGGKHVIARAPPPTAGDLDVLRELIEAGKVHPVVDRRFPLEQIPDAHRYMDAGLARGSVVVAM